MSEPDPRYDVNQEKAPPAPVPSDQLAAMIEADRQRRLEEFRQIVEEVSARLRVQLVPIVTISGNHVTRVFNLTAGTINLKFMRLAVRPM